MFAGGYGSDGHSAAIDVFCIENKKIVPLTITDKLKPARRDLAVTTITDTKDSKK